MDQKWYKGAILNRILSPQEQADLERRYQKAKHFTGNSENVGENLNKCTHDKADYCKWCCVNCDKHPCKHCEANEEIECTCKIGQETFPDGVDMCCPVHGCEHEKQYKKTVFICADCNEEVGKQTGGEPMDKENLQNKLEEEIDRLKVERFEAWLMELDEEELVAAREDIVKAIDRVYTQVKEERSRSDMKLVGVRKEAALSEQKRIHDLAVEMKSKEKGAQARGWNDALNEIIFATKYE